MKLDPKSLPLEVIHGLQGGEGDFNNYTFNNGQCKIMFISIEPGTYSGLHTHKYNCEMCYILEGKLEGYYDGNYDEPELLGPGDFHYCPMGHSHSLKNVGETTARFIGIVPEHCLEKPVYEE